MKADSSVLSAGASILRGAAMAVSHGLKLSLAQQIGHIGLMAAMRDAQEPMRLRAAHLRKFSYTKTGEHTHDRTQLDNKRYSCNDLRQLRSDRGVGKRARRYTNMVKMTVPWALGPRYIGFNMGLDTDGRPIFENYAVFRAAPSRKSTLRRCDGEMRRMTEEQWLFLFNRMQSQFMSGLRVLQ